MRQFKTEKEAGDWCVREGNILTDQDGVRERIFANLTIAKEDFQSAKDAAEKKRWNSAYKMHYDVLHQLAEAYLLVDKIKSRNHHCLFAYLCAQYPELEFDWNFLEKVRTKRNGVNYYGTLFQEKDWKEAQLQFQLYIKTLQTRVEKYLESTKERS
ncbi:MAG: hypothetical protein Q8R53_00680 [Nanoarchaeota archaeon]|nr:hypothetical protein [Nanoarchaeota archaeon]